MKTNIDIEQLYNQNTFDDLDIEFSSEKVWKRISKKLVLQEFLKFGITKFNIYYLATGIIATVSAVIILVFNQSPTPKPNNVDNPQLNQIITQDSAKVETEPLKDTIIKSKNEETLNIPKKRKDVVIIDTVREQVIITDTIR